MKKVLIGVVKVFFGCYSKIYDRNDIKIRGEYYV